MTGRIGGNERLGTDGLEIPDEKLAANHAPPPAAIRLDRLDPAFHSLSSKDRADFLAFELGMFVVGRSKPHPQCLE